MADIQVRWSEHEARKPYARPFGVSFLDDGALDVVKVRKNFYMIAGAGGNIGVQIGRASCRERV